MSRLREFRLARGLSQERLAEMINSSQPTIQKLESGRMRLTLDYAVRLAPALGVHPDELLMPSPSAGIKEHGASRAGLSGLMHGEGFPPPPATRGSAAGTISGLWIPSALTARGERALPILSAARGGVDQEMFLEDGPIDWTAIPDYLRNARDPYGMYVVGESMMPRFRPAQLLHVNPHKPPATGSGVVVVKKSKAVLVKEYIRRGPEGVWVREYRPTEREFLVPMDELDAVHTIVGLQEPS